MPNNAEFQRTRSQIRRKLGLEHDVARLCDDAQGPYAGRKGYARVQFQKADGEFLPPVEIPNLTSIMSPGRFVRVEEVDGKVSIVGVAFDQEIDSGGNPQEALENKELKWVTKAILDEFKAIPIGSTEILISPGFMPDGTRFNGAVTTTLTTAIGNLSAGQHQLACVYVQSDRTLDVQLATAKDALDPLTVADIAECHTAADSDALPVVAVQLVEGVADITDEYLRYDLRLLFSALATRRIATSSADVTNPPTDAELDSAFGTPTEAGAGFVSLLDDAGGDANVYLVASNGTSWWYAAMTKAT